MEVRILFLLVSSICLCALGACTSSTSIRITNPDAYELRGDRYHVTLKTGWKYSTRVIRVANDSAYFNSKAFRLKEIQKIETKSFSAWKTLGLMTASAAAVVAAALSYGLMLMMSGRTNSV